MKNGMKTIEVQGGNKYIMVNERVKFFHDQYPKGAIRSELVEMTDRVIVKTFVYPDASDELRYFTGFAYEMVGSSFINKTSALENCETSSVGRALGFLGIGIDTSIASHEEVENAKHQQNGHQYFPSEELRGIFAEIIDHPCFKGKKKDIKDAWKNCTSDDDSQNVLRKMQKTKFLFEKEEEAKKKEVA